MYYNIVELYKGELLHTYHYNFTKIKLANEYLNTLNGIIESTGWENLLKCEIISSVTPFKNSVTRRKTNKTTKKYRRLI